jgi:cyclophilin family peptidyl-prolyl cis-trans isomerase
MKTILISLLSVLLLAAVVACSGNDEGNTESDAESSVRKQEPPEVPAPDLDALAKKTGEIRDSANPFVTLETSMGKMTLELFHDVAPTHVDSFIARTQEGFYDSTKFHRIIDNFMIQGGDPKGDGTGNAGYFLKQEFSELPHMEGTLSMARARDPNSASCQFFICLARNRSTQSLDNQYTIFGQLIDGYDVLHKIGQTPVQPNPNTGERSQPVEPVWLVDAYMSDVEGNPAKKG